MSAALTEKAFSECSSNVTVKSDEGLRSKLVLICSRPVFLSFLFGFVVRLIPEVLTFPYLIGYDPIYYVWRIESGVVWHSWPQVFSTWLFYATLIGLFNITQMDPLILVKLTAPLLFGLNACGIYYFATKALGWTHKKGLLASVFFSLQLAALTFSSNFYRNMLGLGILLFALPLIKDDFGSRRQFLVFMLLSVLVVFSHEYGSVVLFAVVLGFLVSRFLKGTKTNVLKVLMAVFPALALFLAIVFARVFPMSYEAEKNIVQAYGFLGNYQGVLFFLRNYLAVYDTAQYYPVYLDLASRVFSFFASLYIVTLPLVIAGFFKDDVLDGWTALLFIGSFAVLVTPFFAFDMWYRWMFMLVYPFTFYAVNGITKVLRSSRKAFGSVFRRVRWMKLSERVVKLILILPFSSGLVFVAIARQGSTVPLRDVDDTIRAMQWLDTQMDDGSALLAHVAFSNWARLYLDKRHILICFKDNIEAAIDVALQHGFNRFYFVWWNGNNGLHWLTLPNGFIAIFNSGRISVFEYLG